MSPDEIWARIWGWVLILAIAGVIWALLRFGGSLRNALARRQATPAVGNPEAPDQPATAPPPRRWNLQLDSKWLMLPLKLLGIALIGVVVWLIILAIQEFNISQLIKMTPPPSVRPIAGSPSGQPERVLPDNLVLCLGPNTVAATIEPGEEIFVWVSQQADRSIMFSFEPDSDEGTLKICDYFNPERCDTPGTTQSIASNVFRVENITTGASARPVPFTCSDGYESTRAVPSSTTTRPSP